MRARDFITLLQEKEWDKAWEALEDKEMDLRVWHSQALDEAVYNDAPIELILHIKWRSDVSELGYRAVMSALHASRFNVANLLCPDWPTKKSLMSRVSKQATTASKRRMVDFLIANRSSEDINEALGCDAELNGIYLKRTLKQAVSSGVCKQRKQRL